MKIWHLAAVFLALCGGSVSAAEVRMVYPSRDVRVGVSGDFGGPDQDVGGVAVSADVALAVWTEWQGHLLCMGRHEIPTLARLDAGVCLPGGNLAGVAAAGGSERFLVTWGVDNEGIKGIEVPRRGPFAAEPFMIADDGVSPHVASDGNAFLVSWMLIGPGDRNVRVAYVRDGAVTPSGGVPVSTTQASDSPRVAWTGTSYVVVWRSLIQGPIVWARLATRFVGASGVPEGSSEIALTAPYRYTRLPVSVASNAVEVLVGRGWPGLEEGLFFPASDAEARTGEGTVVPVCTRYVAWDGASFVASFAPIAAVAPGVVVAVIAETVTVNPLPHEVRRRVFVALAGPPQRARAVRR